jgi:hypothetical protein
MFDSITPQNTATPVPATIGQFGGYTFSADCFTVTGGLGTDVDEQGPAFTYDGVTGSTSAAGNAGGAGSISLPASSSPANFSAARAGGTGKSDTEAQFGTLLPNSGPPFELNVVVKADQTGSVARCHASIAITPTS